MKYKNKIRGSKEGKKRRREGIAQTQMTHDEVSLSKGVAVETHGQKGGSIQCRTEQTDLKAAQERGRKKIHKNQGKKIVKLPRLKCGARTESQRRELDSNF